MTVGKLILARAFIIVVGTIFLQACATRPPASLTPYKGEIKSTNIVSVMSVSTRSISLIEGNVYGGERSSTPSFAFIDVSIPPNHKRGKIEWPSFENPDPGIEFAIKKLEHTDPDEIPGWFEQQKSNGRVFIFVHGYNVRYSDAVYRISQIATDLGTDAAPILFSWPSRGKFQSYAYDKSSAMFSRDVFEMLLDEATKSEQVKEITILAHSMGGFLTMETLRQSAIRNGRVNEKIKDVILASPDIDRDIFETQMATLGEKRPHFTIVVSKDDKALRLSKLLSGNIPRIGSLDLSNKEIRELAKGKSNVTLIDLSNIKVPGSLKHSKFADSAESLNAISKGLEDAALRGEDFTSTSKAVLITLANSIKGK